MLPQMGTHALREGAAQRESDSPQAISHEGIEPQALGQQGGDILEQGLGEAGPGIVDGSTVSLVHGNVLHITAARAAM
jgi:hypothetical protein